MRTFLFIFTFSCFTALLISACSALFEKDLGGEAVEIFAPGDNDTISAGDVQFWWSEVDGATSYEFQLVRGDFSNPINLVLSTDTPATIVKQLLSAGEYEWQVKARNSSSETGYNTRVLTIDSIYDLSSLTIDLISPSFSACLNEDSVSFSWQPVDISGVEYDFLLVEGEFEIGDIIFDAKTALNHIEVDVSMLNDETYYWGVSAKIDNSTSSFFTRPINIDRVMPLAPVLASPINNDTIVGDTVIFNWSNFIPSVCSEYDSLFVFDELGQLHFTSEFHENSNIALTLNAGSYSWRVSRYDDAGNGPARSITETFIRE